LDPDPNGKHLDLKHWLLREVKYSKCELKYENEIKMLTKEINILEEGKARTRRKRLQGLVAVWTLYQPPSY
jgi:hypothetical protein